MKIIKSNEIQAEFFKYKDIEELDLVKKIINDVKNNGDEAVKLYTEKFDNVKLDNFEVSKKDIKKAYDKVNKEDIEALHNSANNIKKFSMEQIKRFSNFDCYITKDVIATQIIKPIENIGIYTPGGLFPLPSTVLMCGVPAKISGANRIILCSPPSYNGSIHPAILVAADIVNIDEVYSIGGAQSIGAMAYGTESIKPVDKIVGPGNKFVAYAKKEVFGIVGIDFIAGPSEILIIADDSANPCYIANDLLSQAEHDSIAIPILITNSEDIANKVNKELKLSIKTLKTKSIAEKSLQNNGVIIITKNIDEAINISNKKAPEHLELQIKDIDKYINKLNNYGSLFVGEYTPEAYGDYSCGVNHTLPTNTTARYTGGLNVKDFLKFQTILKANHKAISSEEGIIPKTAERLAKLEGLEGHFNSVNIRKDTK